MSMHELTCATCTAENRWSTVTGIPSHCKNCGSLLTIGKIDRPRLTHWIGTRESPCSNVKDGDRLDTREVSVTCAECYLAIAKSKESSNGLPRSCPTGPEGGSLWGDHPSLGLGPITEAQAAGLADGFRKIGLVEVSDKVRAFQEAVGTIKVDGIVGPETIAEVLKCIEGDTPAAKLREELEEVKDALLRAREDAEDVEQRRSKERSYRGGPSTEQLFESQLKEIVDLRIEVEKWKTRTDNACAATSAQVKAKDEEIKYYKDLADYNYEQTAKAIKSGREAQIEVERHNQKLFEDLNALRVVYADLSRKNSALQGDFDLLKASMEAAHGGDTCEQMQKGHDRLGEAYNKLYFAAQKFIILVNSVWMDVRGEVDKFTDAKRELQTLVAFGMEKK